MFRQSPFNRDVSRWDTSSVEDMHYIFDGATFFNQDLSGWDFRALNHENRLDNFLNGATSFSPENYGKLLERWASQIPEIRNDLRPRVSSQYPSSAATHWNTLDTYGWTITDDGEEI